MKPIESLIHKALQAARQPGGFIPRRSMLGYRLVEVSDGTIDTTYTYNGLGERLSMTRDSVTTHYVLDMNATLTQALQDDTNTYLYGLERVAQYAAEDTGYFLADALGSVRPRRPTPTPARCTTPRPGWCT